MPWAPPTSTAAHPPSLRVNPNLPGQADGISMASLLVMIGAQGTSTSAETYRRSGQWLLIQILGRYDLGLLEGTY
jgi:hypothetical protein